MLKSDDINDTLVKMRSFCLPLILIMATSSVQASLVDLSSNSKTLALDKNESLKIDSKFEDEFYKQFGEALPELSAEQTQLAMAIHNRLYTLYPSSFYQQKIDKRNIDILIMYQLVTAAPDEISNDSDRQAVECLIDLNQITRYKEYTRRLSYDYVGRTSLAEVQDTLKVLDYPLIDELVILTQKGDVENLTQIFLHKMEQQGFNLGYEEFVDSPKYAFLRKMVILDGEGREPMETFLYANTSYCVYKYMPPEPISPTLMP